MAPRLYMIAETEHRVATANIHILLCVKVRVLLFNCSGLGGSKLDPHLCWPFRCLSASVFCCWNYRVREWCLYVPLQTRLVRTSAACWFTVWPASVDRSRSPSPTWCTRSTCPSATLTTTSNAANRTCRPTSASWASWWTSSDRCALSGRLPAGRTRRRRPSPTRKADWRRRRLTVRASWWTQRLTGLVIRRPWAVCHRCRRPPPRRRCLLVRQRRRRRSNTKFRRHRRLVSDDRDTFLKFRLCFTFKRVDLTCEQGSAVEVAIRQIRSHQGCIKPKPGAVPACGPLTDL